MARGERLNGTHGRRGEAGTAPKIELRPVQRAGDDFSLAHASMWLRARVAATVLHRVVTALDATYQQVHPVQMAHQEVLIAELGGRND